DVIINKSYEFDLNVLNRFVSRYVSKMIMPEIIVLEMLFNGDTVVAPDGTKAVLLNKQENIGTGDTSFDIEGRPGAKFSLSLKPGGPPGSFGAFTGMDNGSRRIELFDADGVPVANYRELVGGDSPNSIRAGDVLV